MICEVYDDKFDKEYLYQLYMLMETNLKWHANNVANAVVQLPSKINFIIIFVVINELYGISLQASQKLPLIELKHLQLKRCSPVFSMPQKDKFQRQILVVNASGL